MAEEFDALRYIASYPDLIQAFGADAEAGRQHWLTYGQAEGRNPFLFNPFIYGASHPDLIAAFGTNYAAYTTHYIQHGFAEGRATSSFDYLGYSASNEDLLVVYGTDPTALARHYLEFGHSEGRSFSRFDALTYAASNSDVAAAYGDDRAQILTHYINHGYYEHRPTSGFDYVEYVAANRDLLDFGYLNHPQDALYHYLQTGADEGRPTDFDERAYLLTYADLAGHHLSEGAALNHWINSGVHEGRVGDSLFGHDQATHALPVGSTTVAAIDFEDDRDWFELNLAQGTFHSLLTTNADGSIHSARITVHDQYGVPIASRNVQTDHVSGLGFTASYAGTYFVVVESSFVNGTYRLSDTEIATGTMSIGGRNYTDEDFAGVHDVRHLELRDHYSVQFGPNAQAAGIRVVNATSDLASTIDASAYTVGLTVDVNAGGGDTVLTGSGNDHVIAGSGAQNFSLGSGDNLVTGAVSELHTIDSGPGTDTIRVTGDRTLDLAKITGVERIEQGADRMVLRLTTSGPAADAHYTIVGNGNYPFSWIFLQPTMTASNISFTIVAAPGGTFLTKDNDVHNAIEFIGGVGPDFVQLGLDDLGPDVMIDGGDGVDRYVLSGTTMTDADFGSFSNMEILDQGVSNITLGDLAAASGLTRINLRGDVSRHVVFEPDFTGEVEIYLTRNVRSASGAQVSSTVHHLIDASASPGRLIFTTDSSELQANDIVRGGTGSLDVLNINYLIYNTPFAEKPPFLPPFDLTNLTGVETINVTVVDPDTSLSMSNGPMILDTAPGDLDGTDTLTINLFQVIRGIPEPKIFAAIDASAATANLVVNGVSYLAAGSGNDTILAAQSVPTIIIGNAGDDSIIGGANYDQLSGGSGADVITGAGGSDRLSGGSESDSFRYTAFAESDGKYEGANRDTISDFVSGTDVIDVTSLQGEAYAGQVIDFLGNGADLAAAQALLTPGDATFDAVYQQDAQTLWFDNGDGVLDVQDLRIVLTGVASLIGADVLEGSVMIG
ncbi:MAG TPA: calcium-binding protein [Allosphingosinicella sp.]|jgi:Ca2+-binding RTX toxin-like protein